LSITTRSCECSGILFSAEPFAFSSFHPPNHVPKAAIASSMLVSTLGARLHPISNPSAIPSQLGRPFTDYVAGFMVSAIVVNLVERHSNDPSQFEVFLYGEPPSLRSHFPTWLSRTLRDQRHTSFYRSICPVAREKRVYKISTSCPRCDDVHSFNCQRLPQHVHTFRAPDLRDTDA
jgi:hypothetical protein